ncbi:MAG: (d)CMP kinase, partial [Phaeodactylibacter sp.]|nr:(d)CMP kinase [Phaeodactylibacter sp.]
KALAKRLGYAYIDTGAMYRATTLHFLRNHIDLDDPAAVRQGLDSLQIHFEATAAGNQTYLNGENVEEEIRKMYVSEAVSPVAALSAVRRDMVRQQQEMGNSKGVVLDGRDIGTVVFPDAELKIFLTADPMIRAQRRYDELKAKGQEPDFEAVLQNLQERDHIDSTRADSPLKKAEDAIEIDNSHLSQEQQLQKALDLVQAVFAD